MSCMWWRKYPWLMFSTGPLILIFWSGCRLQYLNLVIIWGSVTNPSSDGEPGKILMCTFINDNNATKKHIYIYCRVPRTFYQQILLYSLYMQNFFFYTFSITCNGHWRKQLQAHLILCGQCLFTQANM